MALPRNIPAKVEQRRPAIPMHWTENEEEEVTGEREDSPIQTLSSEQHGQNQSVAQSSSNGVSGASIPHSTFPSGVSTTVLPAGRTQNRASRIARPSLENYAERALHCPLGRGDTKARCLWSGRRKHRPLVDAGVTPVTSSCSRWTLTNLFWG